MKIIIPKKKHFKKIKEIFKKSGYRRLYIVSDFDKTLTYAAINGKKIPSIISLLRNGNYLSENYSKKAQELFEKYHPIENNPKIPLEKKRRFMQEWWKKHYEILIKEGVKESHLENIINNRLIKLRKGVKEFLKILYKNNIPILIVSADGFGEAIPLFLRKNGINYSNIFYIVNRFVWDKNKNAIAVKKPIIHTLNKDIVIRNYISKTDVKNRKNVILLGDSLEDIRMLKGLRYKNAIKIGFLNISNNQMKKKYIKNFDIVLEGDGDFSFLIQLIKELKE